MVAFKINAEMHKSNKKFERLYIFSILYLNKYRVMYKFGVKTNILQYNLDAETSYYCIIIIIKNTIKVWIR